MRMRFALSDAAICRSIVTLMLVLVLALVPVACGSGDDDVAVASDLIERWMAGWNNDDSDAIAAVFTEDGTFIGEGVHEVSWTGRDGIRLGTLAPARTIGRMEFAEPVTKSDDGTYRCTVEYRAGFSDMVAEDEFEVDDGLISRLVGHDEFVEGSD